MIVAAEIGTPISIDSDRAFQVGLQPYREMLIVSESILSNGIT
jgi:hypothetical protein